VSPGAPSPRTRGAFAVCVAAAALTLLDLSKINVTLPAIQHALGATPTELQLLVVGYALSFGLALVPAGRYGDARSRRRILLAGLIAFAVVSLACSLATTAGLLVAGRLAQGVVAGALMPQVLGIVQHLYTGKERTRAFGVIGMVTGLCVALGPTIGGFLITVGGEVLGWRLIWLMNVPLALALLPFAFRLIPRDRPRDHEKADLDPLGLALLALAVGCLLAPFVLTTGRGSDVAERWWFLLAFAALLAAFVMWERRYTRRGGSPVVDVALFRIGSFRLGTALSALQFGALPATFLVLNLFVQQGLHQSAFIGGLVLIPYSLTYIVSAWLSVPLSTRMGAGYSVLGFSLMLSGLGLTMAAGMWATPASATLLLSLAWAVAGVGTGGLGAQLQALSLSQVPTGSGGVAGSISQLAQRLGTAVGVAAASTAYYLPSAGDAADGFHVGFVHATAISIVVTCAALGVAVVTAVRRRAG